MERQKKTNKTKTEEQKQQEQQALEDLKRHMDEMQAEEERVGKEERKRG